MYERGQVGKQGETSKLFMSGFLSVFSSYVDEKYRRTIAKTMYEDLRCGLDHYSLPKESIGLMRLDIPFGYSMLPFNNGKEIPRIAIDPEVFLDEIEDHFQEYIARLRGNSYLELRNKFTRVFSTLYYGTPDGYTKSKET